MNVKKIAVLGASGQIGFPLAQNLMQLGHEVVAISRARNEANQQKLNALEVTGAALSFCSDFANVEAMSQHLTGCDVLVASTRASEDFINRVEPKLLEAAQMAGVRRFVPNEFGCHTLGLEYGDGILFDYKKRFQEKLFASGMEWMLFYMRASELYPFYQCIKPREALSDPKFVFEIANHAMF